MDDPLARLAVLNGGGVQRSHPNSLAVGSDVEIAARVNQDLSREYGQVVHAEGQFWRYIGTDWEQIPEHELRLSVHEYDGARFSTPTGQLSRVGLNKSRASAPLCMSLRRCWRSQLSSV